MVRPSLRLLDTTKAPGLVCHGFSFLGGLGSDNLRIPRPGKSWALPSCSAVRLYAPEIGPGKAADAQPSLCYEQSLVPPPHEQEQTIMVQKASSAFSSVTCVPLRLTFFWDGRKDLGAPQQPGPDTGAGFTVGEEACSCMTPDS